MVVSSQVQLARTLPFLAVEKKLCKYVHEAIDKKKRAERGALKTR